MIFNSRFIYNAEATQSGGADTTTTDDTIVELPDEIKSQLQELQELRTFKDQILSKEPDKTPEQLAKDAELEKVNFRKYAVEADLMKDDDFSKLETLKQKEDKDLVFEDFSAEWDADNPDVDPDEKEALKKEAFENQYHLNSDNKTLKTRGEKILAKEATEKRNPLENTFKTAQEQYGRDKTIAAKIPEFNKFIDATIKESVPDKVTIKVKNKDGEQEAEITDEIELTKEQKTEIDKIIRTPRYFKAFSEGKPEEVKSVIQKKIDGFIKINTYDSATQKSFDKGKGVGVASGSNVGAENLFMLVKGAENKDHNPDQASVIKQIRESHEKIRLKNQVGNR